jgi:glycosyltransferase involved in cell wall biosynthesis
MKIALVSTFPPQHCGIATYTQALALGLVELAGNDPLILSEHGGKDFASIRAIEAFSRGDDYSGELLAAIKETRPDIVHFQHADDIFGMGRPMLQVLEGCRQEGIPTVVTLHTVYTTLSGLMERKPFARVFHQALGAAASHLIVHQESAREVLVSQGVPEPRISVIPHGTPPLFQGDGATIRRRYGLADGDSMLLFFGFLHVQKNIHVLLRMMPLLLQRCPNAKLVIVGEVSGGRWYNRLSANYALWLIKHLGIEKNVRLSRGFVPAQEVNDHYLAADVTLLPHFQAYHSASGVAHLALAAGKPLVCSDVPKFEDIKRNVTADVLVHPRRPELWAKVVGDLLTDPVFAQRVVTAGRGFAARSSWSAVADQHQQLYRQLVT